jgi:TRAP-type C4-dicarboxylate transport system permease large subunit
VSRLPQEFGGWLTGLTQNPLVYLAIVNVLLLVVGCFMEALAAMLVLIPILVPLFAVLALITVWPAVTTFLPSVLLGR